MFLLLVVLCTDIQVSNYGVDIQSCEHETHPCKTLSYAIKKGQQGDTIIPDGGKIYPMTYVLKETQYLYKSLLIKSKNRRNFRPIIKKDHTTDFDLFHIPRFNNTYLSLHGMTFFNMLFSRNYSFLSIYASERNISVHIDINDCVFQNVTSFLQIVHITKSTLNIDVRNSKFLFFKRVFIANVASKNISQVKFHNVTFAGGDFSLVSITGKIDVIFTNSTFKRSKFALLFFSVTSVKFTQCKFNESGAIFASHTNITLLKTSFSIRVRHTTFLFKETRTPFFQEGGIFNIFNINMKNRDEPTIAISHSNMYVNNCNFNSMINKVSEGGALYIEYTTGKSYRQNLKRTERHLMGEHCT